MTRHHRLIAAIRALALAGACISPAQAADDELSQTLVTIDDYPITALHLALFASQTGREPEQEEEQIRILNEVVNNFMIARSTEGQALAARPEVSTALEVARARLLTQAFVRSEMENAPVDEAQIKAIYDAEYANLAHKKFKARHILLNSRDAAAETIKALDGGGDFAALATQHSIGPSKSVGGDLGWFEPDAMVPEFSAAIEALTDGSYSKEPVKTQFGWHVILREESRDVAAPAFDSVRSEIEQRLRQKHVAQLIYDIRQRAKVELGTPEEGK